MGRGLGCSAGFLQRNLNPSKIGPEKVQDRVAIVQPVRRREVIIQLGPDAPIHQVIRRSVCLAEGQCIDTRSLDVIKLSLLPSYYGMAESMPVSSPNRCHVKYEISQRQAIARHEG